MLIWLLRLLELLCCLMAGWILGRSAPSWEGDADFVRRGSMGGLSFAHQGNNQLGGFCLAGTGSLILWLLAALALHFYAWPVRDIPEYKSVILYTLLQPGILLIPLFMLPSYVWARLTDKGPVGPLE